MPLIFTSSLGFTASTDFCHYSTIITVSEQARLGSKKLYFKSSKHLVHSTPRDSEDSLAARGDIV